MPGKRRLCHLVRALGAILALSLVLFNFSPPMRALHALPNAIRAKGEIPGSKIILSSGLFSEEYITPVAFSSDERLASHANKTVFRLFGVFPIKSILRVTGEEVYLSPGGTAVGITIHTDGVLVVGLGSVETSNGTMSPGSAAGLLPGDRILSLNGTKVRDSDHLQNLVFSVLGTVSLTVQRGETVLSLSAMPVAARDGVKRLGLWVRDSTAGVGTVSFYDAVTNRFAALGHAVSDVDTHSVLPLKNGCILPADIVSVIQGTEGLPGELTGAFSASGDALGVIDLNTEYGIFGTMNRAYENNLCDAVILSEPGEAHIGGAALLSTVSGSTVESFQCEITRISSQTEAAPKGMVIEVTDERLIGLAGGIVQGMSGSPVLQDGRLIGVVTHVFVNDPLRGYCVYAKWMFEKMNAEAAPQ